MSIKIVREGNEYFVEKREFPWVDFYRSSEYGDFKIDGHMQKACNSEEEAVELYDKWKREKTS